MNANQVNGEQPKFYAGIGSRQTPTEMLTRMTRLARDLGNIGWTLRSGGADGADSAFAQGAIESTTMPHIYLPWSDYNPGNPGVEYSQPMDMQECRKIAHLHHPAWDRLSIGAVKLHARNSAIMLGPNPASNPVPVSMVICWTPDSQVTGGTGQALRIAIDAGIPIINMASKSSLLRLMEMEPHHTISHHVLES